MAWLTPLSTVEDQTCLSVQVRDVPEYRRAIAGALLELTYGKNWSAEAGGVDPEIVAEHMLEMFGTLTEGRCIVVGDILLMATDNLPPNRLWCDGSSYPVSTYPLLFDAIGYTFGGGAGVFRVPDFRGRVPVGAGSGSGLTARTVGDVGGAEQVTLTEQNLPSHNHPAHSHGVGFINGGLEAPANVITELPGNTGDTGSGSPVDIMPPFLGVRYAIVAQ